MYCSQIGCFQHLKNFWFNYICSPIAILWAWLSSPKIVPTLAPEKILYPHTWSQLQKWFPLNLGGGHCCFSRGEGDTMYKAWFIYSIWYICIFTFTFIFLFDSAVFQGVFNKNQRCSPFLKYFCTLILMDLQTWNENLCSLAPITQDLTFSQLGGCKFEGNMHKDWTSHGDDITSYFFIQETVFLRTLTESRLFQ